MKSPTLQKPRRLRTFDSLHQEVYLNLWRTYDKLKQLEDELFGKHGLSPQQYNALRLLRSVHPGTMPTLALGSRLVSRAPDMTRLLDKLEERDLVERTRRKQNRRVVEVGITPGGLALLDHLSDEVKACHRRQLGHLDRDSLERLAELLCRARLPHERSGDPWPGN